MTSSLCWVLRATLALPLLGTLCTATLHAQALTTNPYSAYGIGIPYQPSNARNWGMAGVTYALPQYSTLSQNPALYSDITLTTIEAGGTYSISTFTQGDATQKLRVGGLNHLGLGFPTRKKFSIAIGLDPFSNIGYQNRNSVQVLFPRQNLRIDTLTSERAVLGEGGISQFQAGAGFRLLKDKLRLGASFVYLFGNSRREFSTLLTGISSVQTTYLQESSYSGSALRLGVAYGDSLFGRYLGRVGLTYQTQTSLRQFERITQIPGSLNPQSADTTFNGNRERIPVAGIIGLGFALDRSEDLSIALDIEYRDWSRLAINGNSTLQASEASTRLARGEDNWLIRAGVEWVPNAANPNYFSRIAYRAGVHYQTGYLSVLDNDGVYQQQPDYGARVSLGLPLFRQYSKVHVGAGYGWRGTDAPGLIREAYPEFFVGLSFNELWFIRRAYD